MGISTQDQIKKLDDQIKAINKKKNQLRKKALEEQREIDFKKYKNVYDAMHGFLSNNGITDEMILNCGNPKDDLRNIIFSKINPVNPVENNY